jgi:hypothetical protein
MVLRAPNSEDSLAVLRVADTDHHMVNEEDLGRKKIRRLGD